MTVQPIAPIHTKHGVFHHYRHDNAIGSHLRRFGEWAEEEIFLISRIVKPGWTALDVGANIGTHTIPLSRLVGASGKVFAFEPQSTIFPILGMNVARNGAISNTHLIKTLVSDVATPTFTYDQGVTATEGNMGSHTFIKTKDEKPKENGGEFILELSIDDLALERCDFIKIDVQGFEPYVLKGAARTLSKFHPIIYYEQMGLQNHAEISGLLKKLGYDLLVHYARPYNLNNHNGFLGGGIGTNLEVNILALPPGPNAAGVIRDLKEQGVTLFPIETYKGHGAPASIVSPWRMRDDAYAGTPLAAFIGSGPALGETVWSEDLTLPVAAGWQGKRVLLKDLSAFGSFECELDTSVAGSGDINVQLLLRPAEGEPVWVTLLSQAKARNDNDPLVIRLTHLSFDLAPFAGVKGEVEIRCRSSRPEEGATLRISNCRIRSRA